METTKLATRLLLQGQSDIDGMRNSDVIKKLTLFLLFLPIIVNASLDDYIELDEDQAAELNAELGQDVDIYFAHRDLWIDGKDAPLIQFIIYTVEEDGADTVGSYVSMVQFMQGKSDTFKMLAIEFITRPLFESTSQISRVSDFEFFDELSAFMFATDYIDSEDNVYQQVQIMQWSDDGTKKCVISSDSSERIAAFYEDSVSDALIELMTYCSIGLNAEGEINQSR